MWQKKKRKRAIIQVRIVREIWGACRERRIPSETEMSGRKSSSPPEHKGIVASAPGAAMTKASVTFLFMVRFVGTVGSLPHTACAVCRV